MYKLPEDIEQQLQAKYGTHVHIPSLVHFLFQAILEKTIHDGACHIREFGKYIVFKTESSRHPGETVRFKFRISASLDKKLKTDQYLIQNIPVKAKVPFTEKHEIKVLDKKETKFYNYQAGQDANKHANKMTRDNVQKFEIQKVLEGTDDDNNN
jgi:hypothetical protein